jgi:ankyrin repeat protein
MVGRKSIFRISVITAGIAAVAAVGLFIHLKPRVRVTIRQKLTFVKEDSELYDAINAGASVDAIKPVVEKRPELVRTYRWDGEPPLILAAGRQRSDLVMLFLEAGADVNAEAEDESGKKGGTALHAAAWNGDIRTIEILLRHKADSDLLDDLGRTPLDIANELDNDLAVNALKSAHR